MEIGGGPDLISTPTSILPQQPPIPLETILHVGQAQAVPDHGLVAADGRLGHRFLYFADYVQRTLGLRILVDGQGANP